MACTSLKMPRRICDPLRYEGLAQKARGCRVRTVLDPPISSMGGGHNGLNGTGQSSDALPDESDHPPPQAAPD